ncbi:MAG: NADH-quinone oxidoreductase subunit C [Roseiflexaceae bacterium]|nr:NADH-quinone oxidoreductase subunit C [Roseiflexaceae bacterium]
MPRCRVASWSTDDLKAALARDLPGVLAAYLPPQLSAPAEPRKKGAQAPVDLLSTQDALIHPHCIADVARYLRDTHSYTLLTNLTAVDYLRDNVIELVYHFARVDGGVLTVKTRVPREAPTLPSLAPTWPGADFQEREAYDLYGVIFQGHQNLRRIYMWDEFEGFPMRKDFPKQGDKYIGEGE